MDFKDVEGSEPSIFGFFPPSSDNCTGAIKPSAYEYLPSLSPVDLTLLIAACVMTLVTVGIYAEEIYHLETQLDWWRTKRKALVLLGIYPVTSVNAMGALLVPRSTGLNDLCTALYYSVCLFLFSQMILGHFGGKRKLVEKLKDHNMRLNTPPLCCCCLCLPKPKVTLFRLNMIEACIVQFVIYQPIVAYIEAMYIADHGPRSSTGAGADILYAALNGLNTVSTLLAIWGSLVLFWMSHTTLKSLNIRAKFMLLQAVIALERIQGLIWSIVIATNSLGCIPPLNVSGTADRIHQQLVIFEMLILSCVARVYYRYEMNAHYDDDMRPVIRRRSISVGTKDNYGSMNTISEEEFEEKKQEEVIMLSDDVFIPETERSGMTLP